MSSRLLEVSSSGQIATVDDTLRQIGTVAGEVKTVCIVGPTRTGKSFLLNYLAGQQNCFRVENGGCVTKGVDITNKPIMLSQIQTNLVDVEGMGDKSSSYDFKLCLPVLAVADVILLNVRGQLGRTDMLNLLNRFVYMYERVCKGSSQGGIGQFLLPHLILVMRDWTNRVGYETEYLAKLLATESNDIDPVVKEQNEIRKTIKKCFQSVDMITLPLPTSQDVLESDEELKFDRLSKKFIDKIADLKQMVAKKLSSPTATIFGNKFASASEFVNILKRLANEVNKSEFHLPSMLEALKAYHIAEIEKKMENWAKHQCPLPTIPQNPTSLHTELQTRYLSGKNEFQRCSSRLGLGFEEFEAKEKFNSSIEAIHKRLEEENDRKILQVCDQTGEKFLAEMTGHWAVHFWGPKYLRQVETALSAVGVKMASVRELSAVDKWMKKVSAAEETAAEKRERDEKLKKEAERSAEVKQITDEVWLKVQQWKLEDERFLQSRSFNNFRCFPQYSNNLQPNEFRFRPNPCANPCVYEERQRSHSASSNNRCNNNGVVGYTPTGLPMYRGRDGGIYHISSGGNRVYH